MREKLIELLDGWDCPILLAVCEAESLADYLIANGVTVREKGEWIDKPTGAYGKWQTWCSACGQKSGIGGIESNRHKPFCPNCGAKMDGVTDG